MANKEMDRLFELYDSAKVQGSRIDKELVLDALRSKQRISLVVGLLLLPFALLGLAMAVVAFMSGLRQVDATPESVRYDTVAVGTLQSVEWESNFHSGWRYVIFLEEYEEPFIAQSNYRLYERDLTDAKPGTQAEILCNYQASYHRYICEAITIDGEVYASLEKQAAYQNNNGQAGIIVSVAFLLCGIVLGVFAGANLYTYAAMRRRHAEREWR